jgi:hypothetical protein
MVGSRRGVGRFWPSRFSTSIPMCMRYPDLPESELHGGPRLVSAPGAHWGRRWPTDLAAHRQQC